MGQGVSKRQSYTPGETKDSGLPSGPVEVNGEVKTGANGLVELLSNKEVQDEEVTDTSSAPVTPTTSSPSPTSPADNKKKKKSRFVFSLKRTGSGKRSRKSKNEANGVRPVSYPAPTPAPGAEADKANARPQSLFLEDFSIPEDEDGKIETVSLSSNDEKKKEAGGKGSSRKSSSSSKKEKKKGDSQKKKNSKKKEKEAKVKAEKQRKEDDKEKFKKESEKEKEKEEKTKVIEESMNAAVAKMEELSPPHPETPEVTVAAGTSAGVTLEVNTETTVVTEETDIKSKAAELEVESPKVELPKIESPTVEAPEIESPKVEALEIESPKVEATEIQLPKGEALEIESSVVAAEVVTPECNKTEDVTASEERVEAVIEVAVAAVANSAASIGHEDVAGETAEVKEIDTQPGEITVEQQEAVLDLIIAKEGDTGAVPTEIKEESEEQKEEEGALTEGTTTLPEGQLSLTLTPPVGELQISKEKDEDEPVGFTMGSVTASLPAEEIQVETNTGEVSELSSTDTVHLNTKDAVEEVLEETTVLEVHSAPKADHPELRETEENIEQKIEVAVESAAIGDIVEQTTEGEVTLEAAKSDLSKQEVDVAVDGQAASEIAAAAAVVVINPEETSAKPETEDSTPPMSPTQLKALEKERKLAKKREEKERARKEKEEKKKLKEQKKREIKEKKQKEKEEKERKLREAREKVKAPFNTTVEVSAKTDAEPAGYVKVVADETMAASCSEEVEATKQPPTPTGQSGLNDELHTAKVDIDASASKVSSEAELQSSSSKDGESKGGSDEGVLGSSVKDIISSIEHNVVGSSEVSVKPADDTQPPAVPSCPYPDEEDEACSSPSVSSVASSPVSTVSPFSSAPQSPASVESPSSKTPISPETGESARSGVLRKIELGPRLRTAILRKSSSGAESEEKRVSLTVPRHVQVSDLTPPPRKQGPRRPLQQAWSPLGAYNARSPQRAVAQSAEDAGPASPSSQDQEPQPAVEEPAVEEVMTVDRAVSIEAALSAESQALSSNENKAEEEATAAAESSEDHHSSQKSEEYSVVTDLVTPGSRVSVHADPESPTIVSVASIVLGAGEEKEEIVADTFPSVDPPHLLPEAETIGSREDDVADEKVQPQPSEAALQKMAADLVTQVQQAAQEEAAAKAQVAPEDSVDVSETCEVSDNDAKGGVEEPDSVTESHYSVHCSGELVQESTDCSVSSSAEGCVSDSAALTESAAALIVDNVHRSSEVKDTMESLLNCSRDDGVSVSDYAQSESERFEQIAQVPEQLTQSDESQASEATLDLSELAAAATALSTEAVIEEASEEKPDDQETEKEELSTSTLSSEIEAEVDEQDSVQLQQFNKNYNDMSVVVGDNDGVELEHEDAPHSPPEKGNQDSDKDATDTEETSVSEDRPMEVTVSSFVGEESSSAHDALEKATNGQVTVYHVETAHNGDASDEIQSTQLQEQEEEQLNGDEKTHSETVTIITRLNGSHVEHVDSNSTIDAYLKLQGGVVAEGKKLADALEANNNGPGETSGSCSVQAESTSSTATINVSTSDSTNESVG